MAADRFLSLDWGSTCFRLRLVAGPPWRVLADHCNSEQGISQLSLPDGARAAACAAVLAAAIEALSRESGTDLDGLPVVVSGMASSAHGWRELPYATLPFPLDGTGLVAAVESGEAGGGGPVHLLSGVRAAADVMRGEETELVGLFTTPVGASCRERCVVILPGTHSKHVRVEGGRVVDFRTVLTGELFALLCEHSVLQRSVAGEDAPAADAAFAAGLAASSAGQLLGSLFQVRAQHLLEGQTPAAGRAFLSGLLIGTEIHELLAWVAADCPVVLAAAGGLGAPYAAALRALAAAREVTVVPPADAAGLVVAGQAAYLGAH